MSVQKNEFSDIDEEHLNFIKTNLRYKRNFSYYLNFGVFLVPAFFVVIGCLIFYYGRLKPSTGAHIGNFLPMLIITFGIVMAYFFLIRIKEAERFVKIPISKFDIPTIEQSIQNRFDVNQLTVDGSKNTLRAQTRTTLLSWGEELVIIQNNDQLLINSRSLGSKQPVRIIKNRKNVEKLKGIIEKTCC